MTATKCAFCYDREQGKNGEVKREWAGDWNQFVPVCRKHTFGGVEGLRHEQADEQAETAKQATP